MTKTSAYCGIEKPVEAFVHRIRKSGRVARCYCKGCDAARSREYRRNNLEREREREKRYHRSEAGMAVFRKKMRRKAERERVVCPEKRRAREYLKWAIQSGKIEKPSECSRCGVGGLIHGHHDDYSKPIDVIWLCPACHAEIERGEGT